MGDTSKTQSIDLRLNNREVMKRLLRHSFKDINYQYSGLTPEEKKLVSKDEFEVLVAELGK